MLGLGTNAKSRRRWKCNNRGARTGTAQEPQTQGRQGPQTKSRKIGLVKSEPGVSPPNASPPKTNLPLADSGHQTYGSLFLISSPLGSKKGQLMSPKQSEFGCGDGMGATRMHDTARPRPQARGCDLAGGVAMRCQKGGVVPGLGGAWHRLSEKNMARVRRWHGGRSHARHRWIPTPSSRL